MMELKPCPFCGEEVNEVIKPEDRGYLTICCGLVGSMISVAEWNTRPIEGNLKEHIAELELIVGRQANELRFENANWTAAMTKQQEHIAELESENARITELALDQADKAIKRIGELEAENANLREHMYDPCFSCNRLLHSNWQHMPKSPEVE